MDKKLKVIPKPKEGTRTVLLSKTGQVGVFFSGSGNINLVCGNCGKKLCENMNDGQIQGIVFQCPVCRLYNDT